MAKPAKGKASVKVTSSGKKVSYGQKGAKVRPGTSKGDSYCARSSAQMKKHPKGRKEPKLSPTPEPCQMEMLGN